MFLLIPIAVLLVCLFLSKASGSDRIWKFCWINVAVLLGYSLIGWLYLSSLPGGDSIGISIVFFCILFAHLIFLLIATVVMTMAKASKDQRM
jgi:biotin transporter BioY